MTTPDAPLAVSHAVRVSPLLHRVRSEFLEMPGLRLTIAQASRLWALDTVTSEHVLHVLVDSGFLRMSRDGFFLRVSAP